MRMGTVGGQARAIGMTGCDVKPSLSQGHIGGNAFRMNEDRKELSREERLAAKLRENLRRRKAQARSRLDDGQGQDTLPKPAEEG
ncbi:hypothetical protein WYH_02381 [Croceibacterium atlanticum]|uniref:Uncharacterized protein n=1 Tax=Croceibacterium atlanticum TaxID=1267766 RepID=A0A0F7KSM9_9SPHN|nr:hypothetical protein WYH_02381 [Croceibacterium atlanticum]